MTGYQFFINVHKNNKVKKRFFQILRKTFAAFFVVVFFFTYFAITQNSYADSNDCDDPTQCGIGRIRSCSPSGYVETLKFDPTQSGADIMFDLSNPVCLTVILTSYAAVKASIALMCSACGLKSYPSITPSPVRDLYLITQGSIKAASSGNGACGAAVAGASASLATALAQISVIYGIAKTVFENTEVCGASWLANDPKKYNISKANYKAEVEDWISNNPRATTNDKKYREWLYDGVEYEDNPVSGDFCQDPTGSNVKNSNGHYPRQKYYLRGTQPGNYNCSKYDFSLLPSNADQETRNRQGDYDKAYQCCKSRSQNFICINYNTVGSGANKINNTDPDPDPLGDNDGVFCQSGTNCIIKGITFSAAPIETGNQRLICAQSYSLCPYNFTIGKGGSKYCDYFQDGIEKSDGSYNYIKPDDIKNATSGSTPANDCNTKSEIRNADCTFNSKAGQCKNYCHYLTHCTVVGASTYQYVSSLNSPYFSAACINFVGDSRNQTSFDTGIIVGNQRHFSAPIAQCVKETLENVFYNRAGHSQCFRQEEIPNSDGTCISGNYIKEGSFIYKKGNLVKDISFFSGLQNTLQYTVRLVLTLAIMFYGLKLLVAHNMQEIKKSDILMFCIKIGLVMYFATGDAWQNFFFEGVYNASNVFSKMVFDIESSLPDYKKDGCQFDSESLGANNQYPYGKDYLSIWDTLDCKTARYLGFGPSASTANIAALIFAGLFTGPYGIYFVVGLMCIGFFFLAATIRALHIFLSSAVSIILMIYVSPIIIPTALFSKTASIFKNWLTNLISFCLQPMILFAYISIFIVVLDNTLIGSATFSGSPPNKTISCKSVCKDQSGNMVNGDINCDQPGHAMVGRICKDSAGNVISDNDPTCSAPGHSWFGGTCQDASGNNVGGDPNCTAPGHELVDPLTDSIACLVSVDDYGKINFLETIGISVPDIISLFTSHPKEKILTLVKGAFILYVLSQFMDQIPNITQQLIGGAALKTSSIKSLDMMKSVAGIAESIQSRAIRGGMKYGSDSSSMIKDMKDKESDERSAKAAPTDQGQNSSESSQSESSGSSSSNESGGSDENSG
ncbi:MAG: type IV secretion system protein [Rickettsiales bacterium]|nr:type IV secretion system protein [Rickettsiales bacterium]